MNKTLLITASLLLVASPAFADKRSDSCDGSTRDNATWGMKQSWANHGSKASKAKIDQCVAEGKIVVDATGGKGGAAAYTSTWKADWTDSFTVNFDHEMESLSPASNSKSAASGVALGLGDFDLTKGYASGVNVQIVQTKKGRSIEVVAKRNNKVKLVASTDLTDEVHTFQVVWVASSSQTVTVKVFADGDNLRPVVQLSGVEKVLAGKEGTGMSVALFGSSTGNWKFKAKFDNVSFSGDDFDDAGDAEFNDADDTTDDHGGHMDDGEDDGSGSSDDGDDTGGDDTGGDDGDDDGTP